MPSVEELVSASPESHGVLIAGPGAGKSYNIGKRVDSLVEQGIQHHELVILTLTNETARTLRGRFPVVPVRTVHAYALSALLGIGAGTRKQISDRWETKELVSRDVQRVARSEGTPSRLDSVRRFLRRMGMGFREEQRAEADLSDEDKALLDAMAVVRTFLEIRVFDEFAPELVRLLESGQGLPHPPRAVVVDEYQDLTPVELRLVHLVASGSGAGVFACGDDRQSIYGFRGADPLALSQFSDVYGTEGPAYLAESRRCPQKVIDLAEAIADRMPSIAGFSNRPRMTSHPDRGEGELNVLQFPSPVAEVRWIASDIARRKLGHPDDSLAVIVARDLPTYVAELNKASRHRNLDLKFADSRRPAAVVESGGFRIAYALMRLAQDGSDQLAWRTILHLTPGIGDVRISALYASGNSDLHAALLASTDHAITELLERVDNICADLRERESSDRVLELLNEQANQFVATPSGMEEAIARAGDVPTDEGEAESTTRDEPWREVLAGARRAVRLVAADSPPEENEVLVYTVHAAKGQEWDHVYIAGAYEQGYQDQTGTPGEGLRRLYVAVTRSLRSLTVTKPQYTIGPPLEDVLGTQSPRFHPQFVGAVSDVGANVERMPAQA